MKTMKWILATAGCLTLAACGEPVQKFRVEVVDQDDKPMKQTEVAAWFNRSSGDSTAPLDSYKVVGVTDSKGVVELSGETNWYQTSVFSEPEGYYPSNLAKLWITKRNGNRWEPWPVELRLVMKKIGNPHPMYVIRYDGNRWKEFPEKQLGPFGFDLEKADWIGPFGKGEVADFVIQARRANPDDDDVMPAGEIVLTFSNPEDGIQMIKDEGGALLVGPSKAPDNGYRSSWRFSNKEQPSADIAMSDEAYVFRVRTVLDDEGKVISARYGKLDGRVIGWLPQAVPSILMTYYLNAAPNERSLEWDTQNNLFKDLDRAHWPSRP